MGEGRWGRTEDLQIWDQETLKLVGRYTRTWKSFKVIMMLEVKNKTLILSKVFTGRKKEGEYF